MPGATELRSVAVPVLIGRLDIKDDPILAWTGPGIFAPTGTGDAFLDGQTYSPIDAPVSISDVGSDQGIGGPAVVSIAGEGLDDAALRQLVRDRRVYLGRRAVIWIGFMDAERSQVLASPPVQRLKAGVITRMSARREGVATVVEIEIDADLGGARGSGVRIIDHPRLVPGDNFGAFAVSMLNDRVQTPGLAAPSGGDDGGRFDDRRLPDPNTQ